MSADDVFEVAKNCGKCNAPKPDHAKRHERAHVADDGGEDNAESHDEVSYDEIETAHWANDNDHGAVGKGTGNDFGLTATHVDSTGSDMNRTTQASTTTPYVCQVCRCPAANISANGSTCEDCAQHGIKWYPARQTSYSKVVMDKVKTVALLYTIICIIQHGIRKIYTPHHLIENINV